SQIAVSMIDACHIVPFSVSHDDTVSNGIALCPNLHRAFDRGLISIDNDYTVKISSLFREEENPYSIRHLEKKKILLPLNKKYYPSVNNLEWHRSNVFKY
ncbi:MAG: HNH endonuclease, partial [Bacteroidota bacterium]